MTGPWRAFVVEFCKEGGVPEGEVPEEHAVDEFVGFVA